MRVLVTGGCGFIGSNLAVSFRTRGWDVVCFDNFSRRGSDLLAARVTGKGCKVVRGDIRNAGDFSALDGRFDVMLECSAEPSVLAGTTTSGARFVVDNNLVGSVNCFDFARDRQIPVLFLSTSRVYPYDRIGALPLEERETRFECVTTGPGLGPEGISEEFPLDGVRSLYGATKLCSELLLREYSAQFDLP
ncbi:MAG TPA: NAD-dependent epimerase/dehydratase family protein, partial [Kiritimatiellia bacterium]